MDSKSVCGVCYSNVVGCAYVDWNTYTLPPSGENLKEKLQQWRRDRGSDCVWTDASNLRFDEAAFVCDPCLSLVVDIDRMEVQIGKRFRTLWCLMELREEVLEEAPVPRGKRRGRKPKQAKLPLEVALEEERDPVSLDDHLDFDSDGADLFGVETDYSAVEKTELPILSDEDIKEKLPEIKPRKKRSRISEAECDEPKKRKKRKRRGEHEGEDSVDAEFDMQSSFGLSLEDYLTVHVKELNDEAENEKNGKKPLPSTDQAAAEYEKQYFIRKRHQIHGSDAWFRLDCRYCSTVSTSFFDLILHTRVKHPDCLPFICHFCFTGFECARKYLNHVLCEELTRGREGEFKCRICDNKDWKDPRILEAHYLKEHQGQDAFSCPECPDFTFPTFKEFCDHRRKPSREHQATKKGMEIKCLNCNFYGYDQWDLGIHRQKSHDLVSPFRCPGCKCKNARTAAGLEKHMVDYDLSTERRCSICGTGFLKAEDLDSHLVNEHGVVKSYKCTECGKPCESKSQLMNHIRHKHELGVKLCPICGKTVTADYLQKHMAAVHNKEDNYFCKVCFKGFPHHATMRKHMSTAHQLNNDAFTFPCTVCGKVCSSHDILRKHKFINHGIREEGLKIFKCQTCSKELVGKVVFDQHLLTHTGEKPHACPHCDHRVAVFGNLLSHIRQTHNRRVRRVFLSRENRMNYIIVDENMTDEEAMAMADQRNLICK